MSGNRPASLGENELEASEGSPPPGESEGNRLVEEWLAAKPGAERDQAFRRIFERYYRILLGFFAKRISSREECEDLTQETFVRVHKKLAEFRRESRFETWLFQIAANLFLNVLRDRAAAKRNGKEVPLDPHEPAVGAGPELESKEEQPLDRVLADERKRVLREAIEELPPQMQNCVLLRVDGGYKYHEIAELMGVSVDTVKAHLFQARQKLKKKLAEYFQDIDL